ncbi:restriction endonuclease subunit S [candidate division WWE3 bacterium]|jgi:type I restriction enzyme, S subunit|nr:restriction endonuclease subunit S [candidate division WWE3 bacterium]
MKLLEHFKELSLHTKNAEELKGLILQLAVQGKLTANWRERNPIKQTSEELLDIINQGKIEVLLDSGVKKEKPIDEFDIQEVKFELPKSWVWVRFTSTAYICRGGSPRPIKNYITEDPNGINWIKIGDTKGVLKYIEKCKEKIIPEGLKMSRLVKPGDFILSNSMSFGKPYIMKTSGCIHDGWLLIREVKEAINKDYLYHMLSSPYVYSSFKESAAGGVVQNLNIEKVRQTLIPIPPLEEQKAIVEVVNTLFAEVEQLESLTKERIQLKESFVVSALNKLTITENTQQEWNFLQPHFSSFFTEKKNIQSLRETILQLAVQGKLTENWRANNPNTEPASELLKRIEAEKQQLIAEKKIKKEKPLPPIKEDEKPYELPKGWVWCRLGEAGFTQTGSTPPKKNPEYYGDFIPFIGPADITNQWMKYPKEGLSEKGIAVGRLIPENSTMMVCIGGSIGKCNINEIDVSCNQQINTITPIYNMPVMIRTICQSPYFQNEVWENSSGSATPIINKGKWENIVVPIPPLEEQQAIVEKVNSLMALCDELEQQIDNSQTQIEQLMQSCLKEVFDTCV